MGIIRQEDCALDALKFRNPGSVIRLGRPGSTQSSDLLVELGQSLLQDLSVARVFCGVELL